MEHGMGSKSGPCRIRIGLRRPFDAPIRPINWQGPCQLTSGTKQESRSFRPLIGCRPGRAAKHVSPKDMLVNDCRDASQPPGRRRSRRWPTPVVSSSGRSWRYSAATFGMKQSVRSCDGALVATRSAARLRRYSLAGLPHHTVYGSRTSPFMRKESASSTE